MSDQIKRLGAWVTTRAGIGWSAFVTGFMLLVFAITDFDSPRAQMSDMFFAGWNLAAAFYTWLLSLQDDLIARYRAVCDEQQQMLRAFMENRVHMHFMGTIEDNPPTAPRLH